MADAIAIALHPSSAETTSSSSAAVDIELKRTCLELTLEITAVSGTFSSTTGLTVTIETSHSSTGAWKQIGTFSPLRKAELATTLVVAGARRYVRASWTISGADTPTFTFSLTGEAHVLYASPSDIPHTSINDTAISGIQDEVLAYCCLRATADAESALNSAYSMPIEQWGKDLRGHVADRAMFYAISSRGFDPESSADQLILLNGGHMTIDGRSSGAGRFFNAIASGKLKPVGIIDQTPEVYEAAGFVISDTPR